MADQDYCDECGAEGELCECGYCWNCCKEFCDSCHRDGWQSPLGSPENPVRAEKEER